MGEIRGEYPLVGEDSSKSTKLVKLSKQCHSKSRPRLASVLGLAEEKERQEQELGIGCIRSFGGAMVQSLLPRRPHVPDVGHSGAIGSPEDGKNLYFRQGKCQFEHCMEHEPSVTMSSSGRRERCV